MSLNYRKNFELSQRPNRKDLFAKKHQISIGIDAEDLFNRFYGVPLSTVDDIYSISTINDVEVRLWMSKKERRELGQRATEAIANGLARKTQFQQLSAEQFISIDDSRPTNRMMWVQQFFRVFKKDMPRVMYLTHFPAMKFSNSSTVLRVHDPFGSQPKAFKELLKKDSWKHKLARTLRTHAFIRNTGRHTIVANSNFTAKQFSQIYDIPEQSIKVIPYGFKTHTFESIMKLREKNCQAEPYFLMICGMRGSKRPDLVINEWAIHAKRLPKLIVIGKVPGEVLSPLALNLSKSGSLVLRDFADEESLLLLKINANAMIFASEYEGFGRPVIEALVCGVPSIVNDLEVFQEVGAEFIDVFSLDNPISLIPLLEKYTNKIGMAQSISLVKFGQKYSYSQIGKLWREILA